jgi:hypothetical protein
VAIETPASAATSAMPTGRVRVPLRVVCSTQISVSKAIHGSEFFCRNPLASALVNDYQAAMPW